MQIEEQRRDSLGIPKNLKQWGKRGTLHIENFSARVDERALAKETKCSEIPPFNLTKKNGLNIDGGKYL